ncbi:ABC transporter substrate-binding protein [Thermaerobacter subterraneus]|uniref:ABC transporter substrate-binding protein n=1 Tax=Thermaerobacter subterraneus TaxID=175696 RepID=UPI001FA7AD41|nr:ABC transporter substrate-binding protein [Thermaerobacter subterraneus]
MRQWRTMVVTLVAALILAGCGQQPAQPAAERQAQQGNQQAGTTSEQAVEIFSWWTGAGEEAGLLALIDLFKKQNPGIDVINAAVAGGAGTNAKAVLASRMQAGNPPDTFQVHAGRELLDTWVAAGKMEPLNFLYDEEGWRDKFPKDLIDMLSKDGQIYSVPVNIHRGNVLWYNAKVFDQHGLKPPKTFDEFFQVADALKSKGVTPLALGDKEPWTLLHLWEDILLGVAGPEGYKALFTGSKPWNGPEVRQSLEILGRMLQYVNVDHAARNWQDAAKLVADGQAAMNVMGDWVKGYYTVDLKLKPEEDFGWAPTPNTEGSFMVVSDTFGLPVGIKHRDATIKWLKLLGSVEGQDTFNPLKGSIPARLDADPSKYDAYGKSTMEDFKTNELVPSLAHGSAAPPAFVEQATQVIRVFATTGDVDTALQGLASAAKQYLDQ